MATADYDSPMNDSDNDDEQQPAIVIDNGSGTIKAGFAGDAEPRSIFTPVCGHFISSLYCMGMKEWCVGDEAKAKREMLTLKYPIQHGIVTNWDDMV